MKCEITIKGAASDCCAAHLVVSGRVSAVVDEQVVVTVKLELIETEHEPLEDRFGLEGDEAVQVGFVLRPQHGSIDLAIKLLQEMALAQRRHVICTTSSIHVII